MNRDNPLYESQEIRMEMFADVSDEEGKPHPLLFASCHGYTLPQVTRQMMQSC